MRALLVPTQGGEPIELSRDLTIVGRRDDCDVKLEHKSVSKQHCVLVKTDGLVVLRDLGSTNGTRVNGQRVRRAALVPNDIVAFASLRFRMTMGRDAEPLPAPDARTMQLEQAELDEIVGRLVPLDLPEPDLPPLAKIDVKTNVLPDVYPDDESAGPAS